MISLMEKSKDDKLRMLELVCDNITDIDNLPTTKDKKEFGCFAAPGSTCFVINESACYMLNTDDSWVII